MSVSGVSAAIGSETTKRLLMKHGAQEPVGLLGGFEPARHLRDGNPDLHAVAYRGARGMPSPAIWMISRCTSLTPPPNVPTGADR